MKLGKLVGRLALGALVVAAIPYEFKKNEEDGGYELRSLLWSLKKTPRGEGEAKDHYSFAIPAAGMEINNDETPAAVAEQPIVEDAVKAAGDVVEDAKDAVEDAVEEVKDVAADAVEGAKDVVEDVAQEAKDVAENVAQEAKDVAEDVAEKVTEESTEA